AALTLQALAVACGVLDASAAPAVRGRVGALLARAAERSAPRQCLAAAAYVAALANHPADQVADLALRAISVATLAWPEPGVPPWVPGGAFRHPSAVLTLMWAERYDAAQALADSAVAEAQAWPSAMILPMVLSQRAWVALRRGDLAAADADARAVLDAPGPPISRNRATRVLADVLIERGDLGEAEQTLKQVIADLGIAGVTSSIERHTRGRLRFAQHRFADALSDFPAASDISVCGLATCPSYLPWRSDAALAALAVGDRATARHLSDEELHLARAFG